MKIRRLLSLSLLIFLSFSSCFLCRYGNFFKTHVLGSPVVVSMDPDLNRNILMMEGKGLVMGYPRSAIDLAGKQCFALLHGASHSSVRGVLLSFVGPQAIRETLLPKLDSFMQSFLHGLDGQTVDIQAMAKKMTISVALKLIAGIETARVYDTLIQEFSVLMSGAFSAPINLPGLNYHRALKARKKIANIIGDDMRERRRSSLAENEDRLSSLLHVDEKTNRPFTREQMLDMFVGLVFAGHETIPSALTMALVYLQDNPRVLQEIRDEHIGIKEKRATGETIKWEDYKSMSFTRSVILETMRLASTVSGILRSTTGDAEINGVPVPAGWRIYVCMRENYYDPAHYPEPFQFNPWRWQDGSLERHKRFMMFGGGSRLCPGKELSMVQMSVFLHYFATRYRWEAVGKQKEVKFFRVEAF